VLSPTLENNEVKVLLESWDQGRLKLCRGPWAPGAKGALLVGLQKLNKNIKSLFNMIYLILIKNYVHFTE